MRLQEKLLALRKAQKLSQDDVAEQLNVTRQAISRWESGKSVPSTENLIAIAELFQVPLHLLVDSAATLEEGLIVADIPGEASRNERPAPPRKAVSWARLQASLGLCILALLAFTAHGVYTLLERDPDEPRVVVAAVPGNHPEISPSQDGSIALISASNRQEIGQETVLQFDGQSPTALPGPIISFVESDEILLPSMIQEVKMQGKKTPELMAPNGVMGIFTKDDGSGWTLKAGETLYWDFETYPFFDGRAQTLSVGSIKNGMLCRATVHERAERGRYCVQAVEDGTYYIYFICCSSDRISLKEGSIGIQS